MSYMHGGYLSICAEYYEKKKAEKGMSKDRKKIAQNIVDYYFKKNLPLIPPPELIFKEQSISQEEKQMAQPLDEIIEVITPDGMYIYAEKRENSPQYRLHVHTGEKWVITFCSPQVMESAPDELKQRIEKHAPDYTQNDELPRRCAAQRAVLLNIWDEITDGRSDKEYPRRMGKSTEGGFLTIEPHEQIKSVQVLQGIVDEGVSSLKEEIGKLKEPAPSVKSDRELELEAEMMILKETAPQWAYWAREERKKITAPESVVRSGLTIGAEIAEEKAQKNMFDSIAGINSVSRGCPEAEQVKKCECGSGKLGIPHSLWCPAK